MDSNAVNMLKESRRLSKQVRDELYAIAKAARSCASNVGEQECAKALENLASKYNYAMSEIDRIV